jgi:hypothetical protein
LVNIIPLQDGTKKRLAILIINAAIDQMSLDEETQTLLQTMVNTTIPTAIDLFVAVSKSKYKFKYAKRFSHAVIKHQPCPEYYIHLILYVLFVKAGYISVEHKY